jgi:hypothetical protein
VDDIGIKEMSAKLLKSLAAGSCTLTNRSTAEVIIYWKNETQKMQHLVVRPGTTVDMLQFATIAQLRKSPNLKDHFNDGFLKIAEV